MALELPASVLIIDMAQRQSQAILPDIVPLRAQLGQHTFLIDVQGYRQQPMRDRSRPYPDVVELKEIAQFDGSRLASPVEAPAHPAGGGRRQAQARPALSRRIFRAWSGRETQVKRKVCGKHRGHRLMKTSVVYCPGGSLAAPIKPEHTLAHTASKVLRQALRPKTRRMNYGENFYPFRRLAVGDDIGITADHQLPRSLDPSWPSQARLFSQHICSVAHSGHHASRRRRVVPSNVVMNAAQVVKGRL